MIIFHVQHILKVREKIKNNENRSLIIANKTKYPALFFIGYSAAGKTTLALLVKEKLESLGKSCIHFDGNDMSEYQLLSKFNGFDMDSRLARAKQLVNLVQWSQNQGAIPIVSVIGQPAEAREYWRENVEDYIEIFLKCSLEVCMARDNKKVYTDPGGNVVGIDLNFDLPSDSDIVLDSLNNGPKELLNILTERRLNSLFSRASID